MSKRENERKYIKNICYKEVYDKNNFENNERVNS